MTRKSAIDPWVAAVLWASAIVSLVGGVVIGLAGGLAAWLVAGSIMLLGAGLPLWMLFRTLYQLGEDELIAISGPLRWRVPYHRIRRVNRERTLIAGPALSMDRLVVDYGPMQALIISPRDPEVFIQALEARMVASRTSARQEPA